MGSKKVREKPEKGKAAPSSPCMAAVVAQRPAMEVTKQGVGTDIRSPGFFLKADARVLALQHGGPWNGMWTHTHRHCVAQAQKEALD